MKTRVLLILAGTLVFVFLGCSKSDTPTTPTTPTADTTAPPVPATLSPASGTTFNHFPRTLTLVWSAETDPSTPVTYRVEIQFCQGSVSSPHDCVDDFYLGCDGVLPSTSCTFGFGGMNPGRWRVKAVDSAGNNSAFSAWSKFAFSI